jgi:cytoskeletal protein CcmA (bactofilin family)
MNPPQDRTAPRSHRRFTDEYETIATLIGRDVTILGELRGATNVDFSGTIEGELDVEGFLWIRAEGRVVGTITADAVVVEGRIEGDLTIRGAVELRPDCHVEGNVTAGSIAIAEGAFFEGGITMGGDEVDRKAVAFEEKRGETD